MLPGRTSTEESSSAYLLSLPLPSLLKATIATQQQALCCSPCRGLAGPSQTPTSLGPGPQVSRNFPTGSWQPKVEVTLHNIEFLKHQLTSCPTSALSPKFLGVSGSILASLISSPTIFCSLKFLKLCSVRERLILYMHLQMYHRAEVCWFFSHFCILFPNISAVHSEINLHFGKMQN